MKMIAARQLIAEGMQDALVLAGYSIKIAAIQPPVLRLNTGYLRFTSMVPGTLRDYSAQLGLVVGFATNPTSAESLINDLAPALFEAAQTVAIEGQVPLAAREINPFSIVIDGTELFCLELQLQTDVEAS
jgi:hypothetical protein